MAKKRQSRVFLDRGSELLEERIAFCDGRWRRSNPIRNFSADQIGKAIQNIHPLHNYIDFEWKKGVLDGRLVLINRYASCGQEVYRDIVVSSQMSSHNNVLKLSGCCLEVPEGPALVYEYAENGCLDRHIQGGSLPWGTRLKIAKEIANAVKYLHTAFPRPIIHRDIKPANIFLNQNYAAKLFDFSVSISIPEGESHVGDDRVVGTAGFLDPDYMLTNFVTEKTDVFSFGVLLLVLLTGRPAIRYSGEMLLREYVKDLVEKDQVNEVVDPKIRANGGEAIDQQQLEAFLELALKCINYSGDDRPPMIEVAKELQRIERSITAKIIRNTKMQGTLPVNACQQCNGTHND